MHKAKLDNFAENELGTLKDYLYSLFDNCPDEYFNSNLRSSQLKFRMNFNLDNLEEHEVNVVSKYGLIVNSERYKENHAKVQMFMLEHDNKTIAMEIPIWTGKDEILEHGDLFTASETNNFLTGHIDLLRIEDGKIWVWDYKPNAKRELYAATQVYFYALMLSKRTGIDLDNFMCGYFDSNSAYVFNPSMKRDLLH